MNKNDKNEKFFHAIMLISHIKEKNQTCSCSYEEIMQLSVISAVNSNDAAESNKTKESNNHKHYFKDFPKLFPTVDNSKCTMHTLRSMLLIS